jgi:GT2 family glycosyltransferase
VIGAVGRAEAGTIEVSILIPVRNGVRFTRACLESLRASMPPGWQGGREYEIVVHDDASTDGTGQLLSVLGPGEVRALAGPGGTSFAASNNRMAREARGRVLVMLNNDTLARPGWLEPMRATLDGPGVGVVGNTQVYPTGRVNHAGVVFARGTRPCHLYEGLDPGTRGVMLDTPRRVRAVTAACWAVRREVFLGTLGGFDEAFVNGYEDVDLCLRAYRAGLACVVAPGSVIVHHGSSTPGRFDRENANRREFLSRWGGLVADDVAEVTARDGVRWPRRSIPYRVARTVWRAPGVREALAPALRTGLGVRARQRALGRLR